MNYSKILCYSMLITCCMPGLLAMQDENVENVTPRKRAPAPVKSYYESPITPPAAQRRRIAPSSAQKDPNFSARKRLFRDESQDPTPQLISEGTVDRWPSLWNQHGNSDIYIKRLAELVRNDGTMLLHIAARKNNVGCMSDLLRYGEADLTAKIIKDRSTPLHEWAMDIAHCTEEQAGKVEGALRDSLSRTHSTFPDKRLLGNINGSTPLHVVCSGNLRNPFIFKTLVAVGHPIDAVNNVGQTILHKLSANDGDPRGSLPLILVELKKKSLDSIINLNDSWGETALHLAVRQSNRTMFDFLMNQPVIMLDLQDNLLRTPLHLAANLLHHNPDDKDARYFYDRLIERGANQSITDDDGNTAQDILDQESY
jgi:ankyrin repeat protein